MKKIGIVCAMKVEKVAIEEKMTQKTNETIYNLPFVIGYIGNTECILVQSGVGKVNAARTTQILIDKYKPEIIINAGVGGSLNPELNIGDVVISKQVFQHDFDITAFDHKKGYVPEVGDYIECDKNLLGIFYNVINQIENESFKTKIGIISSGDQFYTEIDKMKEIHNLFNTDIADMECSSIAQVAYLDNVPFIGIRSVSDGMEKDKISTYKENVEYASEISSKIVEEFCMQY
ncbi:MAG: 5'-methylthioadenosine/adenosylhomocysteine nucleosidase [Clostridia bacterium]|nr:5'-methylthioadenosine/adenosylhomocysteine nucleosidase [Clostridia bacterium]